MTGRRKPYTARGISRVPCVKCGKPSQAQWRICATSMWTPVCEACDIKINRKIATWAFGKETADRLIEVYKATP